jgi:hypothetical protein
MRGLAACLYLAMILMFLIFNAPVNAAVSAWSAATLPADWADYRWKWELGHALAAPTRNHKRSRRVSVMFPSLQRQEVAHGREPD